MRIAKTKKPAMIETGMITLNINVPGLVPENVKPIVRDVRRTLENCASLRLLDGFTETWIVEYMEVEVRYG